MADRQVNSPSHGGRFNKPNPRLIVIHSVEAPARAGLAYSLATGWMQTAGTSVHSLNDPGESVDMVPLDTIAYHVGGGNAYGIGNEHTGYAAWDFKTWTSEPAFSALKVGAKKAAAQAKALGIPMRWLSLSQVRDGVSKGFCTHNDCRLAFGGTTHTDPGPGFPYAIFMQMVQQYASNSPVTGNTPTPTTVPPTGPQIGGADSGEDMTERIVQFPDGGIWVVDYAAHTKWHIGSMDLLNHLKNVGLKMLDGAQAPQFYDQFQDVSSVASELEDYFRKWVSEEAAKVSVSQGYAGAADVGRFISQFDSWVRLMIEQELAKVGLSPKA